MRGLCANRCSLPPACQVPRAVDPNGPSTPESTVQPSAIAAVGVLERPVEDLSSSPSRARANPSNPSNPHTANSSNTSFSSNPSNPSNLSKPHPTNSSLSSSPKPTSKKARELLRESSFEARLEAFVATNFEAEAHEAPIWKKNWSSRAPAALAPRPAPCQADELRLC